MTTGPELEYNLAGGLLLTIFERDFKVLQEKVAEAGFRKACVLSFKALAKEGRVEALKDSPLDIVHIEEAWNPTNQDHLIFAGAAGVWGYAARYLYKHREEEGILGILGQRYGKKDAPIAESDSEWPSKETCDRLFEELMVAFPGVKFISHEVTTQYDSDRWLLEINPGIELPPSQILSQSREGGFGLVFDPKHLLPSGSALSLPGQATKVPRGEWERQFQYFRSGLEVVDINGDVGELFKDGGQLRELAQAAKETPNIRYLRVEIPIPPIQQIPKVRQSQEKGFQFLREVGQALREA